MQAIILSGGIGSRLWPISSKTKPKPFIKMVDKQSLLQKAFARANNLKQIKGIITVANQAFFSDIKNEYSQINSLLPHHFILEPFGKNTTAAIASAALLTRELHGPNELMLILPADHLITNLNAFSNAVEQAKNLALKGKIVTFGIKPTAPVSSYGYLEYEDNKVKRFVEKPSVEMAKHYIKCGNFLWNSGIFCFTAESILQEMSTHCPLILDRVQASVQKSKRSDGKKIELDQELFNQTPEESIDYAVMEKSKNLAVIPCDIGWKDIGTWESLSSEGVVDSDGNQVKGKAALHNVSDCYIENNGQLIGAVGVKNLAIIGTKNGVLVTNKQNSDEVRNIYSQIHDDFSDEQIFPWGKIKSIQESDDIKIDQIEVNPRASFALSDDFHYSANWMITKGVALFSINGFLNRVAAKESKYIMMTDSAFLTNMKNEPLVIITVRLSEPLMKNYQIFAGENSKISNE
jgi:mannose-1-phosphate guanylyltransferase